jgi:phenylalanyl-tRNA synthetase alpha subunit
MSPEEKKDMGPKLAEAKKALTSAYEAKDNDISTQEINQKLNDDIVDITLPTKPLPK